MSGCSLVSTSGGLSESGLSGGAVSEATISEAIAASRLASSSVRQPVAGSASFEVHPSKIIKTQNDPAHRTENLIRADIISRTAKTENSTPGYSIRKAEKSMAIL
ncbi:MAG: hypothetical protein ACF788_11775, partial [Novipirellula sp. JB048]